MTAPPIVWIPERVSPAMRAFLPGGITLRDVPASGDLPSDRRGDMYITEFDADRAVEVIPQLEGLRVVQALSAGVDSLAGHIPDGVTLCDGAGIHDASVAEWCVMAITAMRRNLPTHIDSQRERTWRWASGGADLDGATVLIVGYGSIGRALEARLLPFGAHVERVARHARDGVHDIEALPELLPAVDVVVILLPLTDSTRHIVDAEFLAQMREDAVLVNAARGPIVDTDALLAELQRDRIRAALDVTDPEPLPDDHPLWSAPGVLITPHIGGAVTQVLERAWRFAGEQVARYMRDEPLRNVVSEGY